MTTSTTDLADLVRSVADQHRAERGPLLVMLHAIQDRLGYVDPAVVPLLAEELNLSRADVHGVLTFYHDFKTTPRGRTTLKVCRAEACAALGAEEVLTAIQEALGIGVGETTPDGRASLEQVFCLGNCALGPSAQVDGRVHGRLDAATALDLVTRSQA